MRKTFAAAAATMALAFATSASAAPMFEVTWDNSLPVPVVNDFKADLAAIGLTREAISGSVKLLEGAFIKFEFLGSESRFSDKFDFPGLTTFQENTLFVNNFATPVQLGTAWAGAGTLGAAFTGGLRSGASGDAGFAVFLPTGSVKLNGTYQTNVLYFGYDDQSQFDDNHDDLIIRATIIPVPEPASWAMMVTGITALGFVMRRRNQNARVAFS